MNENMIDKESFDRLRSASVDALRLAARLLAHEEGVYTMDKIDVYLDLVKLVAVLGQGINKAVGE